MSGRRSASAAQPEASTEDTPTEKAVRDWLIKTGYPLEMEVAAAFQRERFGVSQSSFYADPETGEPREIDVTAELFDTIGESDHLSMFVVNIECKKSTGNPWVLFRSNYEATKEALFRYTAGNRIGRALLVRAARDLRREHLPLFEPTNFAYGMTQSLRSNSNDETFRALMQVAKATNVRVRHADDHFRLLSTSDEESTDVLVVISAIVVDGELYLAELDNSKSDLKLTKVDQHVLVWSNPVSGPGPTVVHLVSRPSVPAFVANVAKTHRALLKWYEANPKTIDSVAKRQMERSRQVIGNSDFKKP